MYATDEQQRPVDGEAQDIRRIVEVERLCCVRRKRPVEGREDGSCVAQRYGAVEALNEAGEVLV